MSYVREHGSQRWRKKSREVQGHKCGCPRSPARPRGSEGERADQAYRGRAGIAGIGWRPGIRRYPASPYLRPSRAFSRFSPQSAGSVECMIAPALQHCRAPLVKLLTGRAAAPLQQQLDGRQPRVLAIQRSCLQVSRGRRNVRSATSPFRDATNFLMLRNAVSGLEPQKCDAAGGRQEMRMTFVGTITAGAPERPTDAR